MKRMIALSLALGLICASSVMAEENAAEEYVPVWADQVPDSMRRRTDSRM